MIMIVDATTMPEATDPVIGQPPFENYTLTNAYDEMFAPGW
jgi:hypothetical protein